MANKSDAVLKGRPEAIAFFRHLRRTFVDSGKIIRWAGPKVRAAVATRTKAGTDVEDRGFQPYSARYAERKKGGRTVPVTLQDDGDMLELLAFKKTSNTGGKVFVRKGGNPDRQAIAAVHHRGLGLPQRKWLGMSPTDMTQLNQDTIDFLDNMVDSSITGRFRGVARKTGLRAFTGKKPWKVRNPD